MFDKKPTYELTQSRCSPSLLVCSVKATNDSAAALAISMETRQIKAAHDGERCKYTKKCTADHTHRHLHTQTHTEGEGERERE